MERKSGSTSIFSVFGFGKTRNVKKESRTNFGRILSELEEFTNENRTEGEMEFETLLQGEILPLCWLPDQAGVECHKHIGASGQCRDCPLFLGASQKTGDSQYLIDQLLALVDRQAEEVRALRKLLNKSEELSQVGLHLGGVVHELNNHVGSLLGYSELAALTGADEDVQRCVETSLTTSRKARELLRQLRSVSRRKNTLDVLNIIETMELVLHLLEPIVESRKVQLNLRLSEVPWVIGSAREIRQILVILVSLFLHESKEGSSIHLGCYQKGDRVAVEVMQNDAGNGDGRFSGKTVALDSLHLTQEQADRVRQSTERAGLGLTCAHDPKSGYAFRLEIPVNV